MFFVLTRWDGPHSIRGLWYTKSAMLQSHGVASIEQLIGLLQAHRVRFVGKKQKIATYPPPLTTSLEEELGNPTVLQPLRLQDLGFAIGDEAAWGKGRAPDDVDEGEESAGEAD